LDNQLLMPPAQAATWPDEARMQTVMLPGVPVVAGRDRYAAAQRFLREHPALAPTHWLLDDGFQHFSLRRDADLVLLDAARPFGNGRLLPRGLLRECPRALRRARVVVFTRSGGGFPDAEVVRQVRRYYDGPWLEASLASAAPERSVTGGDVFDVRRHAPVLAVTGIANPSVFTTELATRHGMALAGTLIVPDHSIIDRDAILYRLGDARAVVTTAKDYWRDPAVFADLPVPVFIAPLVLTWDESALLGALGPVLT
jgi:tetraacyldisaccharide 4'-kinase